MKKLLKRPLLAAPMLLVASLLVTGCGVVPTPVLTPPIVVRATETSAVSPPTVTLAASPLAPPLVTPTAGLTATSAPAPTATATVSPPPPTAVPLRISFAPGMTSALVDGSLAAHGSQTYVVSGLAGQLLDVSATPDEGLHLSVTGADGKVPKSVLGGAAFFRGPLPSTQDYFLTLTAGGGAASYTLNVIIAARISFAPGTTSAVVTGNLPAGGIQYYVLGAGAGQLMEVNAEPQDGLRLSIYGVDGTVLMSGMGGGAFFRGYLPSTQDYMVILVAEYGATAYTMNVIIPARISFTAGATSAAVDGQLAAHSSQYYVAKAMVGQTMEVSTIPDEGLRLSIYGVDGEVLLSGMGEGSAFEGTLPSSQDYILVLGTGDQPIVYTLQLAIQ